MYKFKIDLGHTYVFRLLCAHTLQLISSNERLFSIYPQVNVQINHFCVTLAFFGIKIKCRGSVTAPS